MFKQLESIPLFEGLDADTLALLAPLFESFSCTAGNTIFEQGQQTDYLYLILEGSIEILYKPYDGPAITVTILKQGNIFGWSAAIGNMTYTSGALCKDDCDTIRMHRKALHDLCEREPEAGSKIMNLLAKSVSVRWKDAEHQIQSLLRTNMYKR